MGGIRRERVTWTRWDASIRSYRTSHPYQWIWTDAEGTERCYDTKRDALAAMQAYDI